MQFANVALPSLLLMLKAGKKRLRICCRRTGLPISFTSSKSSSASDLSRFVSKKMATRWATMVGWSFNFPAKRSFAATSAARTTRAGLELHNISERRKTKDTSFASSSSLAVLLEIGPRTPSKSNAKSQRASKA